MFDVRMIKRYTDTVLSTDTVWAVAVKKALENMDRNSLKRLLNEHFGLLPTQLDYMTTSLIRYELQRRNKEEKKMRNKVKDLFKITMDGETQQTISIFANGVDPNWFEFEHGRDFKAESIELLLHYIVSMEIGIPTIYCISSCLSRHKIKYVTKDVTKDILTELMKMGVFGDVTKHIICIEDVPFGITGKLRIGRGEFGFGVTKNETAVKHGAVYYYIPENRDPTVLEFKNGKYVRGDNDGGLTAYAPFNLWNSIFGGCRFYETWADVKKAVVEAIDNRKIYVNVPCIPDLIEENCDIDD